MPLSPARIYLDHNATTPLHPVVWAAMHEAAMQCFANPSSLHTEGRAARHAVETARAQVAALLGARAVEVIFTSGGTEANNAAILGAARTVAHKRGRPGQIVVSAIEHPSVMAAARALTAEGHALTVLRVDGRGCLDPAELRAVLAATPADLVSVALVNHELGNRADVATLAAISHAHGALLHTDAVQAAGRIPVDVGALDADLVSVSAHKLAGPKGVGALVVRRRESELLLSPLTFGGQQEKGRRAGTENVPGIVGFGRACVLAREEFLPCAGEVARLRDELERQLLAIPGARLHGDERPGARAPGTANLGFAGVEGELLMMNLDLRGAAVSTGAACSSGSTEPSAVLLALGLPRAQALEAVRFSLGPATSEAEIAQVAGWVAEIVAHVRGLGNP